MNDTVSFCLKFEILRDGMPLPGGSAGVTDSLVISREMLENLYNPEHYVNSQLVTLLQQKLDAMYPHQDKETSDE